MESAVGHVQAAINEAVKAVQYAHQAEKESVRLKAEGDELRDVLIRTRSKVETLEAENVLLKASLCARDKRLNDQVDVIRGLRSALRSELAGVDIEPEVRSCDHGGVLSESSGD